MSNRIDQCFRTAQASGRKVLIPFITAGDPDPELCVDLMHSLVSGGADILELGVPFSDPMADGPVIQAASERAVARGVDLARVLGWVNAFRQQDSLTPVILMGYMNPVERFGYTALVDECARCGVDGLLLVDCPPEEMQGLQTSMDEKAVYAIRLIAPTTSAARMQKIAESARGFIYYVSFKGTTGAGHLDAGSLTGPINAIRTMTRLPVAVGFGIKDAANACAVAEFADAVVIGSALVERLAACSGSFEVLKAARDFVQPVRTALDALGNGAE